MSGRLPIDERRPAPVVAPGDPVPATRPRRGRVRITPARATLAIALAGGIGFLGWSIVVRDQLQIPLMASGFAICGLVLAAIALMAVAAVVRAGREGRDGTAVLSALAGGALAVAALMSLAAAVIMSLIWSGTKGS